MIKAFIFGDLHSLEFKEKNNLQFSLKYYPVGLSHLPTFNCVPTLHKKVIKLNYSGENCRLNTSYITQPFN